MKTSKTVSRITAHVHKTISKEVLAALKEAGVQDVRIYSARSLVMEAKKGLLSMFRWNDLSQDPLQSFFFLVKPDMEDAIARLIIDKGHLYFPGRGSLIIEEIMVIEGHAPSRVNEIQPFETGSPSVYLHAGTGICCIVKRGEGDTVARIPLDMGTCVPAIHFGTGTGVRDKMGLLRITIPAEKEIVYVLAPSHETDDIMEMMIEAGRLDQPGSGFIYTFPVKKGLANIRVRRGEQRHAASIEQIVTAIDHIKGNAEWRRRRSVEQKRSARKRRFIRNLMDLTLLCDAGTAAELVETAMDAGAGGATMFSLNRIFTSESPLSEVSPVRDACSMGIPEEKTEAVINALEEAGAFTERCHGEIHLRQSLRAFTYIGK